MDKKLALQKLNLIIDNEQDKDKRQTITTIKLWLNLNEPFSLVLALAIINEYKI